MIPAAFADAAMAARGDAAAFLAIERIYGEERFARELLEFVASVRARGAP